MHLTESKRDPLIIPHMHISSCSAWCFIAVAATGVGKASAGHEPDKGRAGQVLAQDLEVLPELPDPITSGDIEQTDR